MSTYRSTVGTTAGQLSAEDDSKLRTAVATGANFQDIKDFIFSDRFDLSPQILEDRAREIGAEWSPAENVALLGSLELPLKMDDHRYLDRLQARIREQGVISPLRSIEDIKARINNLMDIGEDYNLRNLPAQPSAPYIPEPPTVNPDYQTPVTSSFHAGAVSPSAKIPSSRSAQGYYYNLQVAPQTVLGNESGGPEQDNSVSSREAPGLRFDDQWTYRYRQIDVIKAKMARHLTLSRIARSVYPICKAKDIESILKEIGYKEWSDEQDNHLLELRNEIGDNLAEIRRRLSGPERIEAEIQGRIEHLSERPHNFKQRRKKPHEYEKKDDRYICLQMARGINSRQIVGDKFPDVKDYNLEKHARKIGATWSEDDNQKLRDKVLEYEDIGLGVDWGSIGEQYDPPRRADAVEIHWKHLRGVL